MKQSFEKHYQSVSDWLKQAKVAGWLEHTATEQFEHLETENANQLFSSNDLRPLVVAFFGGTGTGKSSLLNRLTDSEIAITGATRPTSHEVTLYLHQQHQLGEGTTELPMENTRIHYHSVEDRKSVAWLDMPDFDSVETANRELVEQWLPYVDWLVYVVSPERYHDDLGWQILKQRQQRHNWLFVINHWDEGRPEQYQDFRNKLDQAGFNNSALLRTSCAQPSNEDEFHLLENTLNNAIQEHGLEQLQQTGALARLNDLRRLTQTFTHNIGEHEKWQATVEPWNVLIKKQTTGFKQLLHDQAAGILQPLQAQEEDTAWFRSKQAAVKLPDVNQVVEYLGNQRSSSYLQRISHEQQNLLNAVALPAKPLGKKLASIQTEANELLQENLATTINQAMSTPGTRLQRLLYKTCSWLGFLLPLGIAVWAGWFLFSHYRAGMEGSGEFLGFGFISNSIMLIGLGWFIPWLLKRRLQPSLVSSFKRGVKQGIEQSDTEITEKLIAAQQQMLDEHQQQLTSLEKLKTRLSTTTED